MIIIKELSGLISKSINNVSFITRELSSYCKISGKVICDSIKVTDDDKDIFYEIHVADNHVVRVGDTSNYYEIMKERM